MKSFWIMLLVFAMMLGGIAVNCVFIDRTADKMERAIAALPEVGEAEDALAETEAFWQKRRTAVSISISFNDIRAIDNDLAQMRAAAEVGEDSDYETARLLALSAVAHMRRLERFSLECIL